MTTMRKGDTKPHERARDSRFFHSMEQWYFVTREGFVEGPFEDSGQAEKMLESYLRDLKKNLN